MIVICFLFLKLRSEWLIILLVTISLVRITNALSYIFIDEMYIIITSVVKNIILN